MGKKPTNISVTFDGRTRTTEQLIRKFNKLCKKENIVREYKQSLVFETKAQKRRRKQREGRSRMLRNLRNQKR
jgi:ribosomal protein S21